MIIGKRYVEFRAVFRYGTDLAPGNSVNPFSEFLIDLGHHRIELPSEILGPNPHGSCGG
jgi:hypothetical protein